jgi:hypothetical protein
VRGLGYDARAPHPAGWLQTLRLPGLLANFAPVAAAAIACAKQASARDSASRWPAAETAAVKSASSGHRTRPSAGRSPPVKVARAAHPDPDVAIAQLGRQRASATARATARSRPVALLEHGRRRQVDLPAPDHALTHHGWPVARRKASSRAVQTDGERGRRHAEPLRDLRLSLSGDSLEVRGCRA